MNALTFMMRASKTEEKVDFDEQLEGIRPALRYFALSLCRNEDMADDLAQEALARAWKARASFEPGTNFRAWMFQILKNLFFTTLRKNARMVSWDAEAAERILVEEPAQQEGIHVADLEKAMLRLSVEHRQVLLLVGVNGATYEEAADIVGCAMGTLKSRIARGRSALAGILSEMEEVKRPDNREDFEHLQHAA